MWTHDKLQISTLSEEGWESKYVFEVKERRSARTFFTAIKDPNGGFKDTVLGLNIKMIDNITTSRELKNEYVRLANEIAADDYFIPFHPNLHINKDRWGFVETQVDILFYQDGINNILSATGREIDQAYNEVIGFAAFDVREDKPYQDDFMRMKRTIKKARKTKNRQKQADYLVRMLKNSVVATSMSTGFKGELIGMLKKLAKDGVFVVAKLAPPHNVENVFPDGKPLVNSYGKLRYKSRKLHNFEFSGVSHIYHYFDTVIPRDTLAPTLDYNY